MCLEVDQQHIGNDVVGHIFEERVKALRLPHVQVQPDVPVQVKRFSFIFLVHGDAAHEDEGMISLATDCTIAGINRIEQD